MAVTQDRDLDVNTPVGIYITGLLANVFDSCGFSSSTVLGA